MKVKGGVGALLIIGIENDDGYALKEWKAGVVDGVTLLPDTWYTIVDGAWKKCEEAAE